ncbi:MAG: hypothetical protein IKG39_12835 [Lachnospiraceae bacterium]|nr:hypothetical protein [Lachnospiraceae bacterium]
MKLYRYSHRTPNFEDFNRMTKELEEFIRSDFSDEWPERLAEIQRFQTEDGGFAYVDDWRIESDARVEFCYKPTYLCTAILMKASIVRLLSQDGMECLKKGLLKSTGREFRGHGYEAEEGLEEAMHIFNLGLAGKFVEDYPNLCPEFTSLYSSTVDYLCSTGRY